MQAAQRQLCSDSQDRARFGESRSKTQVETPCQVSKILRVIVPRGIFNDERFQGRLDGRRCSGEFKQASYGQFVGIRLHLAVSNAMQSGLSRVFYEPLNIGAR